MFAEEETPADVTATEEQRSEPTAIATARAPLATDENTEEYAQPQKYTKPEVEEKKENSIDTTDAAIIRRSNTIGNVPPSERPRSQIVRRNTDSSKTTSGSKETLLPENDIVYQHTTSVVKSVIEFNTGVQHAQPYEFVDLVKVCVLTSLCDFSDKITV